MMNKSLFMSRSEDWGTPQDLFDKLNAEFHFTLDAAASDENAKCLRYFTKLHDGLKQDWRKETVFLNPPYGKDIGKWMAKCLDARRKGATVVALVHARTDTHWFHDSVYGHAEIRFIKGRLKFVPADPYKKATSATFPSILCIYRPRGH